MNQTKENLIEAFWKLYEKKKIEKISVKEICNLAGYNRSTFYAHFKDVYEILEEVEERTVTADDFEKAVLQNLFQMGNSQEERRESMRKIIDLFVNNSKYLPVLLGEQGDPGFRRKMLSRLRPKVLERLPDISDLDRAKLDYILEYQSAAVLNMILLWNKNGKNIPMEEFLEIILSVTQNGVQKEIISYIHSKKK